MNFVFANLILFAVLAIGQEIDESIPSWTELDATTTVDGDHLVVVETEQFTDLKLANAEICEAIRDEVSRWIRANLSISGQRYAHSMSEQDCLSLIHLKRSHTSHFRADASGEDRYRGHAQIRLSGEFLSSMEQSVHGSTLHKRLIWSLLLSMLALGSVIIAWTYMHGMRLTRGLYVRKLRWFAIALVAVLLVCCFLVWQFVL